MRNTTAASKTLDGLVQTQILTEAGPGYWEVPLTGFANPRYLAADPTDSTGFDITDCQEYMVAFENGATAGITWEQTGDANGLVGWFPVSAKGVSGGSVGSSQSNSGNAYTAPAKGVRARLRVSSLSVAPLRGRVIKRNGAIDVAPANGSSTVSGTAAEDATASSAGNPVPIGLEARNNQKPTMSATADLVRPQATMDGKQVMVLGAVPELTWQYAAAAGGHTVNTALIFKPAAGSGIRNFLDSFSWSHGALTAGTEYQIRDTGGSVLHRGIINQAAVDAAAVTLVSPIKGAANVGMELIFPTAPSAGIYFNGQGHTGL